MKTDKFDNLTSKITFILNWVLLIAISCTFLVILFNNPYIYNYPSYNKGHYLFAILITSVTAIALFNELILKKNQYKITGIDIALCFFFLSCLISRIAYINTNYFNEISSNFIVVSSIYLIIRLIVNDKFLKILLYIISLTLVIEAIYIVFTLYHSYNFHNYHIFLMGTLDNSGLCAGYIVLASAVTLYLLRNAPVRLTYLFYFIIFILLYLLQSRAALLSFIPVICLNTIPVKYIKAAFGSKLFISVLICISICISVGLFLIKKDSAMGRVLIWNLTLKHSFQSPIYGIGYGEFPVSYQSWQTNYFKSSNYDPDYSYLADLPYNAFNEPLQIFTETGILGLLSFLAIIVSIYKSSSFLKAPLMRILKLALLSLLIFSLFSYPLHSLPILVLSIIIMAIIASYNISKYSITIKGIYARCFFFPVFLLSVCAGIYFFKKDGAIAEWNLGKKTEKINLTNSLTKYNSAYPLLKNNGAFLFDYGTALFYNKQYPQSIALLTKSSKLLPKIETTILLGRDYQAIGNLKEAEKMYFNAMYAIPSRLKPKYYLLKLYVQKKDTVNARNLSKNIIESSAKGLSVEAMLYQQFADSTLIKLN